MSIRKAYRSWTQRASRPAPKSRLGVTALEGREVPAVGFVAGTPYTQTFDGLPTTLTASTSPFDLTLGGAGNWYGQTVSGTARYTTDAGTNTTGSLYNYGASGSTDRALGSLLSGTNTSRFGAVFVNNGTAAITDLTLAYNAEQWRLGAAGGAADKLTFSYALGASNINAGTFTNVPALDAVDKVTTGAVGALNGNSVFTGVSATLTGLDWQPGQTLVIRWNEFDRAGSDDGLAVDDLTVTAKGSVTVPTANVIYADATFTQANGTVIADADPVAAGDQSATVGTTAFATVNGALGVVPAAGTVVVNAGNYADSINITKAGVTVLFQGGASTVAAINDTVADASVTLSGTTLTINGAAASQIDSKVAGTGGLVAAAAGGVTLAGDNGGFAGTVEAASGKLTAGSATAFGTAAALTADAGATVRLNGNSLTVGALSGAGIIENAAAAAATLTSKTAAATTTFDGTLRDGTGGGPLGFAFDGSASGALTLTADQALTGTVAVAGGTLTVNGKLTGATAVAVTGGTLAGTGSATAATTVAGTLSPGGAAPGTLGVGTLSFPGAATPRLAVDLTSDQPDTGYDQLAVVGTADLTGATLALAGGGTFAPPAGTKFTILTNDGTDPVVGTFAGLAEGAEVPFGTTVLKVSYVGGDGNDVVLTSAGPAVGIAVTAGVKYEQTFDGLPAAGSIPLGLSMTTLYDVSAAPITATGFTAGDWFLQRAGGTSSTGFNFAAGTGSSNAGGLYSYGATGAGERALGAVASGTNFGRFGAVFTNTDTVTLTQFTLSFTAEQWRNGGSAADALAFAYAVGATGIDFPTAAGTAVPDLDVTSVVASPIDSALDGNAAANRKAVTATVTGISWAPGTNLVVRWTDADTAGNDDGLAVDDLSFVAKGDSTAPVTAYYADATFTQAAGTVIPDADPVAAGDQSATVGTTAFAKIGDALAAAPAGGLVVVNAGNYGTESISLDKAGVAVTFQGGASTVAAVNDAATDATITLTGTTLTINGAAASQIDSKVTGTGGLVKAGTGVVTLAGDNNYSGTTQVTAGVLQAGSAAGLSFKSAVSVDAATVRLNGFNATVAGLTGTGTVENGGATAATITVSTSGTTTTFGGKLQDGSAGGALGLTAAGASGASFTVTGDQPYTGATTAAGGLFGFTGALTGTSAVIVGGGTTVTANGSTTAPLNITGTVSPNSLLPGTLSVGDVKFVSTSTNRFAIDIAGTAPGTGYDQIKVTGAVTLTTGSLSVFAGAGFTPAAGAKFKIIDNDGTDPVTGTLKTAGGTALPEGATIAFGATPLTITYVGGDGNDVVLFVPGPANNAPPTITSNGGGVTAGVNVPENTTAVTAVTATDPDGQPLTYSVVGGADASLFTIDPTTGALAFANAPNFEAPVDAGGNNVYDVTVQADDGNGGTAQQAISVTVTNVAAPAVQSVVVNGGGVQRSQVASLVVRFNAAVTLGANAFSISGVGSGGTPVLTGTVIGVSTATVGGVTVATLTFSGANTAAGALGQSLVDGSYTLTVNAAAVSAGGEQMAATFTDGTIFRYLADADGDSAVDGNDLAVLAQAFNSVQGDSNYLAYLDLDNDGAVDGNDLAIFAQRFNTVL